MNPDYYESISLEQAKSIYDLALANFEKVNKKYSSRPFHFLNFRDISESDIGLLIHCAENILLSLRLESIVQEQYYNCKSAEEEKETL